MSHSPDNRKPAAARGDISLAKVPEDLPLSPHQASRENPGNRQAYEESIRSRETTEDADQSAEPSPATPVDGPKATEGTRSARG